MTREELISSVVSVTSSQRLQHGQGVDIATVVASHLCHESEVIRCRAALALAKQGNDQVSTPLVLALLDEDPDVRTDAMSALETCARQQNAEAIRASLVGDPVSEVKMSAINALANLKDSDSVALLSSLVTNRCDEWVYWDDSVHAWDDWLDIQPAAIRALGLIGDESCLPALVAAREDEMGQVIDNEIFLALGQLGDSGVAALVEFLHHANATVRKRALNAVIQANPDNLESLSDRFVIDTDARLRLLAIERLPVPIDIIRYIALTDDNIDVKSAAIEKIVSDCLELQVSRSLSIAPVSDVGRRPSNEAASLEQAVDISLLESLLDDKSVQIRIGAVSALIALGVADHEKLQQDVLTNALQNNETIATLLVDHFVDLLGDASQDLLCVQLADKNRPLEIRMAAARAMRSLCTPASLVSLSAGVIDPLQQIRAACLNTLVHWCNTHTDTSDELISSLRLASVSILVSAISGKLIDTGDAQTTSPTAMPVVVDVIEASGSNSEESTNAPIPTADSVEQEPDVATAQSLRADVPAQSVIWHGPEELVQSIPLSTLESIKNANVAQVAPAVSELANDDEPELQRLDKGKRRRVSVDGPKKYVHDLQKVSMALSACVEDDRVGKALHDLLGESTDEMLEAVLRAFVDRSEAMPVFSESLDLLGNCLQHPAANCRYLAGRAISLSASNDISLAILADDEDALCRALYMSEATVEQAMHGLQDASSTVRNVAIDRLMLLPESLPAAALVDTCVDNGAIDSLRRCVNSSDEVEAMVAARLSAADISVQRLNVLLTALGPA